ncbi:hypothetical protein [Parapedobacter defluvii]|uniref:hypothetical protein n=1 Tax=Parapedobacter defluvii TaxID=2045106 RepID=UPI0026AD5EA1
MRNSIQVIAAALFVLCNACKKEALDDMGLGGDIERVSLLVDYESGYGGYIYPVYNPYVFYKNGTVVKEPKIPIDELDLNTLTKDQAARWGTWQRAGDKVNITYSNGDTAEKDWPGNNAYPAAKGEMQEGSFSSISGGGDLAFGGDVGIISYSKMSFTSDGWYTTENTGGVNSSDLAAYHTSTTSGRYSFDGGYGITLTANNGQTKRFFFCWYGADRDGVFRLGGRTFTEN